MVCAAVRGAGDLLSEVCEARRTTSGSALVHRSSSPAAPSSISSSKNLRSCAAARLPKRR